LLDHNGRATQLLEDLCRHLLRDKSKITLPTLSCHLSIKMNQFVKNGKSASARLVIILYQDAISSVNLSNCKHITLQCVAPFIMQFSWQVYFLTLTQGGKEAHVHK